MNGASEAASARDPRMLLAWIGPVVVAGFAASIQGTSGGDGQMFVSAGRTLLSADWSHAFSHPGIQAGPLQLALFGSIGRSGQALAVVLATATALLVVAAARTVGLRGRTLLGSAGLLAVGAGLTRVGYETGHPADAVLPLIWIVAAAESRRGRTVRAGLLVGLSAGLETWGILGVAVLALAPRWRQVGVGAVVAGALASALFLPFVLEGHFAMWTYRWQVTAPSPLSLIVPQHTAFGWSLRLVQGAVATGVGAAAARHLRSSAQAFWLVPLAIVGTRILLDPVFLTYYLSGLQGPVFVGAALLASRVTALRHAAEESFA